MFYRYVEQQTEAYAGSHCIHQNNDNSVGNVCGTTTHVEKG